MLTPLEFRELFYLNLDMAYQGHYWCYITGHFTHYSWLHCASNLIGLYLLHNIFSNNENTLNWFLATLFIIFIISLGLTMTSDTMRWYVGYSGVLVGLLSYSCVKTFTHNAILSFTFLLLTTTYIASQTILGGELVESNVVNGIKSSSHAHMFGLISGMAYGLLESLRYYIINWRL